MATAATAAVVVVTLICAVAAGRAAEISSGSGVVINAKGEVLTNAHVVENCQSITVRLAPGNSEVGVLVASDEKNDLALVRLKDNRNPPSSVAVFREGAPVRPGDTIVALGYPLSGLLSSDANVSVGNVSALAGLRDDSRYLQISAPVQPGNSGGPLLDASGHLVGIVTAKLDAMRLARFTGDIPQNVNFALKAEVARTFLDSKGITYQTARLDKQLSPADVGAIARPFTVHIECDQGSRSVATSTVANPPASGPTAPTRQQIDICMGQGEPSPDLQIEACSAVIQLDRRAARALYTRCRLYTAKEEHDKAISDCDEAIRLDPNYAEAYAQRGGAYIAKLNYKLAIADYTEAIHLADSSAGIPSDANQKAFRGWIFLNRGHAYLRNADHDLAISDYNQAIRLYDKAIALDPKSARPYGDCGIAYKAKGDYDHALTDFTEAIRLAPDEALFYVLRGDTRMASSFAVTIPTK
jgi:tetratricopeptide (TPR) repeat protein